MVNKYLSYNHQNFNDIGSELFKLAISMSYADDTNRLLVLNNENYTNIIDIFIKCNYKNLKLDFETKENFNLNINYNDIDNLLIDFNDFKFNWMDYKYISEKTRLILSMLITGNSNYINFAYSKINDYMNYFKDYNIANYVCLNINKSNYISYYYEKAYYRNFNGKKLLIRTDDLEWAKENVNFIDKNLIIFIDGSDENKFTDFITLSLFKNYIIDYNYFSWWIAYLGEKDKTIIVPNNNNDFYLREWIRQS